MTRSTMGDNVFGVEGVFKKLSRGDLHSTLTQRLVRNEQPQRLAQCEFWALEDVSFSVCRGKLSASSARMVPGKAPFSSYSPGSCVRPRGSIRVAGPISALIEVGAGFHQDLTGRENIYLNATIPGMTKEEIKRRFDAIVDFFCLEEFIDTSVKRYSSGMFAPPRVFGGCPR